MRYTSFPFQRNRNVDKNINKLYQAQSNTQVPCTPLTASHFDMSTASDLARSIAAGSIAAGITASIFNPLEVVKTRIQLQDAAATSATSKPPLYTGFIQALRRIAVEDGLLRFWSHGWTGFVMRDISYSGIRMGAYPLVRKTFSGNAEEADIGPSALHGGRSTGVAPRGSLHAGRSTGVAPRGLLHEVFANSTRAAPRGGRRSFLY